MQKLDITILPPGRAQKSLSAILVDVLGLGVIALMFAATAACTLLGVVEIYAMIAARMP